MGDLTTLFEPDRVAVVGATDREGSVGYAVMTNLDASFNGEVVPVNPDRETVLGRDCFDAIGDVPDVDLAVVVVPAKIALPVVREAAEAGITDLVVISAGFSETGAEGADRERELIEIAEEHDLNLVGPNSLGILSTDVGLNATFSPVDAPVGNVSFLSQSGAFVTAVLDWAGDRELGFEDVVSLGNKAVLDEVDLIDHWGTDPGTDVVVGYLEDIDDGRAFVDVAREVTRETPVVLVKSGRTDAGATAAASHTGAIAGSDRAYEAGLAESGVLRVHTVQELFDYASILSDQPLPDGDAVAIVTNAGGPGVMTTDAIGDSSLSVANLSDETVEALDDVLPETANRYNPVDIIGDADAARYDDALSIVLNDPNVDMGVVVACPTATLCYETLADRIAERSAHSDVPMAVVLMGGNSTRSAAAALADAGIPSYFDPSRAVGSLEALASYATIREQEYPEPTTFDVDRERARSVLQAGADRGASVLGVEAMDLLDAYGIPTPAGRVVDGAVEAESVAREIEGDVAMKIVSPDIVHKSDIGGVEVGVPVGEVRSVYEDLIARARNYQRDARILGVQVQEMVDLDAGVETIVGVNRDPQFGPLVLFGLGGIFVEILKDTSTSIAPVSHQRAGSMVREIESAPLLQGARGREPVDLDALVDVIQRIGQLAHDFPAILELDCNPVVATPEGCVAVDLRLTLDTEEL